MKTFTRILFLFLSTVLIAGCVLDQNYSIFDGPPISAGWVGIDVAFKFSSLTSASHTVVNVKKGSPAYRDGIKEGDQIWYVGSENTGYFDTSTMVNKLINAGPEVIIQVRREGHDKLLAFTLSRDEVPASEQMGTQPSNSSGPRASTFTYIPTGGIKQNENAIAVIIGNKNYHRQGQNVPNVDFAHNDADLIKRFVVEGLGYREGNIIDLRDATQANLVSVFGNKEMHKGKLYNWLRPDESDVFIYYSGHGAPGLSDGHGYLLPVDADPNTVELNGYPLETLYTNLGKLPAKGLTVIIDACFSGNSQAGMVVKNASPAMLKVVETKGALPNATVITAAGVSEVASWDRNAELGLFTRHFLEGVMGKADKDKFGNGDGKITLGELKNYLDNEVTYMARRLYNREQHPQVSGEIEMILAVTN